MQKIFVLFASLGISTAAQCTASTDTLSTNTEGSQSFKKSAGISPDGAGASCTISTELSYTSCLDKCISDVTAPNVNTCGYRSSTQQCYSCSSPIQYSDSSIDLYEPCTDCKAILANKHVGTQTIQLAGSSANSASSDIISGGLASYFTDSQTVKCQITNPSNYLVCSLENSGCSSAYNQLPRFDIATTSPFSVTGPTNVNAGWTVNVCAKCVGTTTVTQEISVSQTCFLSKVNGYTIPNQDYSSSSTPVKIISNPITQLFTGSQNCPVTSCVNVLSNPSLSIDGAPDFAVKSLLNDISGQSYNIQVQCTTSQGQKFNSDTVSFTQNKCNLVKKSHDPAKVTINYIPSPGTQVIVSNTPQLFFDNTSCQTVTSCSLASSYSGITIDGSYPFAIHANYNVIGGYTAAIQVRCQFANSTPVLSGTLQFEESCVLTPKAVSNQVAVFNSAGTTNLYSDIVNDLYTEGGCGTISTCILEYPSTGGNIAITGSGAGPYAITAKTNVPLGYEVSHIQVQCMFQGGNLVSSIPFSFTEQIELKPIATPTIPPFDYNNQASTVITTNAVANFFTGQDGISDFSQITCTLDNPPTGISMNNVYPYSISAPTNVLDTVKFNIQMTCILGSKVITNQKTVQSNVAVFTQTCIPQPLSSVVIADQNYDHENQADTIVPNLLFQFFGGSSRCIKYQDWDSCSFSGTAPQHLSIVETYPFEIQADLRILGGYTESFKVQCKDKSSNVYTSNSATFTQTCIPKAISPAVAIPSLNYDANMTSEIIVVNPVTQFFTASQCVNWKTCIFDGQDPLSISDTYPFSISADLTRLGGYTRSFTVSCTDNYANPTTYTATTTSFTETCVPEASGLVIPNQNYDPQNKASVIVADSLQDLFKASDCENFDSCSFNGSPAHLSIGAQYPWPITADLSVAGGYTTSFTIDCKDIGSFPKTYSSSSSFTQTCTPKAVTPAVVLPTKNYDPAASEYTLIANPLTTLFEATECITPSQWKSCVFTKTTPSHISISSTYPFTVTADLSVIGGYSNSITIACSDNAATPNVYTSTTTTFTQTCNTQPVTPSVVIPSQNYDINTTNTVLVANSLTTFFTGTGCVSQSDWKTCDFYGAAPNHLKIDSTTYPFAISADLSVHGGYSETFIIQCTDNSGSFVSLPASFTENCVTNQVTPAVVIPSHLYDPVNENGDIIVKNTLTTFFTGTDCYDESDWEGCGIEGPPSQITVGSDYPFPLTAVVDFAPGYNESFTVYCTTKAGKKYTALTSKFFQEADPFKPIDEYVHSLPEMENFPFGVYSGYVTLNNTQKEIYYLLTESQQDWKTDPLLIWMNGGPGCSSLLGWATENGPWLMKDGETSFTKNEYAWNKRANVLYIDNPAGVGFSYCPDKTECVFNDDNVGTDLMLFLDGFYKKFAEYRNHELYLSGESYAGIYVPMFALNIEWHNGNNTNKPGDHSKDIPLKGWAVGNGVTNWTYDVMPATLNTTFGRAIINNAIFDNMTDSQCDYSGNDFNDPLSPVCEELLDEAALNWQDIDLYNLYNPIAASGSQYPMCTVDENENARQEMVNGVAEKIARRPFKPYRFTGDYTSLESSMKGFTAYQQNNSYPEYVTPCAGGDPLTTYLNEGDVREALHIPGKIQAWSDCSNIDYTKLRRGSQFIWEELKGKIKMLKYSGDKDGVVPTQGSLGWISSLDRPEIAPWRAWNDADGQVGGYFWQLEGLNFSTVHGAGHMVPMDESQRAFQLIFNFIEDKQIDPNWKSTEEDQEIIIQ